MKSLPLLMSGWVFLTVSSRGRVAEGLLERDDGVGVLSERKADSSKNSSIIKRGAFFRKRGMLLFFVEGGFRHG